ncbi:MAG: 4Fe-4S binding protein [Parvibaculum sp.]
MRLDTHPTVLKVRATRNARAKTPESVHRDKTGAIDAAWLRTVCLEAGADDVGFVSIDRPELTGQVLEITTRFPRTKTLISIVARMNRDAVRASTRSVANHEFHEAYDTVNDAARHVARRLEDLGLRAVNAVAAFPMEAQNFPGKSWFISHKPIAEAAGLGKMGLHRNVIHPVFGNFIVLDTIMIEDRVSEESKPLDYNPCIECKLCVAACPVEAIGPDGSFNFSACYTHNYRDFLGGFQDWSEELAASTSKEEFRARIEPGETVSLWQSLSFKPSYKAAYCVSVCPAGENVIEPYLEDRIAFADEHLKPLQASKENVYVLEGSDAEVLVPSRFPSKTTRRVRWTIDATEIFSFLFNLTLTFQRRKAGHLNLTCHLHLTGAAPLDATLKITQRRLEIEFGKKGEADISVTTAPETWMSAFEKNFDLETALADEHIVLDGTKELLQQFFACFPVYGDIS